MKLVMTLLVRDEEDIIGENIEFHLAQGIDFFIATDNLSVDGTASILRDYEKMGLLHYLFEGEDNYNQHAWVTRMARMAYTDFGADWIINNDADEFWWPLEGTLNTSLSRLPDEVGAVKVTRHNFVMTGPFNEPFYRRMVFRENVSVNALGQALPPKVAHRASADVQVAQGNHGATGVAGLCYELPLLEILHFPVRSAKQIENKISKGGAAYERNDNLPISAGNTWRKLYSQLKTERNLSAYIEREFHDESRLVQRLGTGEILRDQRLQDFFESRALGHPSDRQPSRTIL